MKDIFIFDLVGIVRLFQKPLLSQNPLLSQKPLLLSAEVETRSSSDANMPSVIRSSSRLSRDIFPRSLFCSAASSSYVSAAVTTARIDMVKKRKMVIVVSIVCSISVCKKEIEDLA